MAILFKNVTNSAGISSIKQSWGLSWGDLNNDGLPDVWINNHQHKPVTMYLNQGNGTFVNVTRQVFDLSQTIGDYHGAAWFDFDNDGDSDLFQISGGAQGIEDDSSPVKQKRLFVNENGLLEDKGNALNINYPLGRGRMPVPVDIDKDGLLDVVFSGPPRNDGRGTPTVFRQTAEGFEDIGASTGLNTDVPNGTFALISNLIGDSAPELIYYDNSKPITIYDTSTLPFTDVTTDVIPNIPSKLVKMRDVAIADFNNDLLLDLYITQESSPRIGLRIDSDHRIKASLRPRRRKSTLVETGIEFEADGGNVLFDFDGDIAGLPPIFYDTNVSSEDIFIGSTGFNPESLEFTLDPYDSLVHGMPSFTSAEDRGVYIGYDPAQKSWKVLWSSDDSQDEVNLVVESTAELSNINSINFRESFKSKPDFLLLNSSDGLVDKTEEAGLNTIDTSGHNVVAGDYDNDMDVDIYIVNSGNTKNLPNTLYENQGDGTFIPVPHGGGAGGTTLGIGNAVAVADYDLDGFLDLYVTNGDALAFKRPFFIDGPNQLFRNQGNSNHWLQIDLQGVLSNRDGIGTQVVVTAGGIKQLREQNSGIHNRSQDFQRIHFGLADNTKVSLIELQWDSGILQQLSNIDADQIINVIEGVGFAGDDTIQGSNKDEILIGNNGNDLLQGNSGNDTLDGGNGADIIEGNDGADYLLGKGGKDTLYGGAGNDIINGGNFRDVLYGDEGADILISGRGLDILSGGAGADIFLYSVSKDGRDTITDFAVTEDVIDISSIINDASFSSTTPFEDYIKLVQSGSDTRVLIDGNGDALGNSDYLIATLQNVSAIEITRDNFIIN